MSNTRKSGNVKIKSTLFLLKNHIKATLPTKSIESHWNQICCPTTIPFTSSGHINNTVANVKEPEKQTSIYVTTFPTII